MNVNCGAEPCPVILNSTCVFYEGENLIYTGINSNDNLEIALQKIDAKFQDAAIGYIFNNGVIQTLPGQPVQLGGSLVQNTVINSGGYTFQITGSIESGAFITTGGTSNDFVKGDGSLDPGPYQPAGPYITALTGDGTASGPGSSVFTLATVNAFPGTYGSSINVPVVTVNGKGLVTNIVNIPIALPSDVLIFDGDVSGSGVTGSVVTLTLDTVNANVYPTNTALKFAVNGKGLVTSAAPITALDIYAILGYTPVPNTRTITINGVTQNLSANRTWNVGTVTSVQLAMPPAFSVTTPPITSAGTINISANGGSGEYINGAGQLVALPFTTSGTSGTSGVDGSIGMDGSSGTSGTSGVDGAQGSSGISGSSGTSGTSGVDGVIGSSGTSGTSGVDGAQGSSGISGSSGTNGTSGTSGTSGDTGSAGTSGSSGTSGVSPGAVFTGGVALFNFYNFT